MKLTGDPFVDAGGAALEYLTNKFPTKSLLEIIKFSAKVFIFKWNNKIDSLQLNSLITHNSKRGTLEKQKKGLESVLTYFAGLFSDNSDNETDNCRICGNQEKLYAIGREFYPLSGSGAFLNFHHSHEKGLLLCKECILKLFFLPFMLIQMGGRLGLLHITNEKLKSYWVSKTIDENFKKIAMDSSHNILESDFKNPQNALFHMAQELILNFNAENEYLEFFYFSNFGQTPQCDIFILPNPVFSFLTKTLKSCKTDWFLFVKKFYDVPKGVWHEDENEWILKGNKLNQDDYKDNVNKVYECLLSGKSLIPMFTKYFREIYQSSDDSKEINSLMLDYYLKEVKNMNEEQIVILKKIGNSIFQIAEQGRNIKKYLTLLEKVNRAYQLRSFLIMLIKKNYSQGNPEPLITLEDYVNYLFPDGQNWKEIRDILLIYLYELLHNKNISVDFSEEEFDLQEEKLNEI